jgi:hypothetical protein
MSARLTVKKSWEEIQDASEEGLMSRDLLDLYLEWDGVGQAPDHLPAQLASKQALQCVSSAYVTAKLKSVPYYALTGDARCQFCSKILHAGIWLPSSSTAINLTWLQLDSNVRCILRARCTRQLDLSRCCSYLASKWLPVSSTHRLTHLLLSASKRQRFPEGMRMLAMSTSRK